MHTQLGRSRQQAMRAVGEELRVQLREQASEGLRADEGKADAGLSAYKYDYAYEHGSESYDEPPSGARALR
jgi:hypothetical protein